LRSVSGPQPSARERRTIAIGLAISLAALFIVRGVLPFTQRWQAREATISAESARLERLRGLVAAETALEQAVTRRVTALSTGPRLLPGRTSALAASALQALLQDAADRSGMVVSQLDVVGAPAIDGGAPGHGPAGVPATLSAIGDIWGVTGMLSLIQQGPQLLEIEELSVRPNAALRGELLQMTVKLHAGWTGSG